MKKEDKLLKNWQFQEIIRGRKQFISKTLILYYKKTNNRMRVGISISKKFIIAVKRNYIRRQVREIITQIETSKINADLVLIVRKPFIKLSFSKKKEEIVKILRKVTK